MDACPISCQTSTRWASVLGRFCISELKFLYGSVAGLDGWGAARRANIVSSSTAGMKLWVVLSLVKVWKSFIFVDTYPLFLVGSILRWAFLSLIALARLFFVRRILGDPSPICSGSGIFPVKDIVALGQLWILRYRWIPRSSFGISPNQLLGRLISIVLHH